MITYQYFDIFPSQPTEANGVDKLTSDLAAAAMLEDMGFNLAPAKPKKPSKAQRRRVSYDSRVVLIQINSWQ